MWTSAVGKAMSVTTFSLSLFFIFGGPEHRDGIYFHETLERTNNGKMSNDVDAKGC